MIGSLLTCTTRTRPQPVILLCFLFGLMSASWAQDKLSTTLSTHLLRDSSTSLPTALSPSVANAAPRPPERRGYQGDVGVGYFSSQAQFKQTDSPGFLFPYLYGDYQKLYARVDTFGVKTRTLGYGHLEISTKLLFDGIRAADSPALRGIRTRQDSLPIGLGTFQETPVGGFFVYALHDVRTSRGNLIDFTYAAKFRVGQTDIYPLLGLDYRDRRYNQYFYGVQTEEMAANPSLQRYQPAASVTPWLGAWLDIPLQGPWTLQLNVRQKWLPAAVKASPLIDARTQTSGFAALACRFN
ncbi:MipA/OmpV family protein [Parvibium lacunae]|uniref:MipA/OmpV family protein n=1 Tax=Parvibium lacunae TaxID=1888893 RepID=A0A368L678_9BURK|nr:MipA/OmpV family protein [Parvibium lacunae]RCS58660.1 MipA/OmpV family protein [Parvibium lacunae]